MRVLIYVILINRYQKETLEMIGKRLKKNKLERQIRDNDVRASNIDEKLITGYKGFYNHCIKRIIDLILALILFVCLLPLFLIISVAIVIEDGFPIFYRAERGGYHNKPFKIYKFRSMVKNADKIGGGTTELNDSRITTVGAFIRKVKFDEIANLICVINGDSGIIGTTKKNLDFTRVSLA